MDSNSEKLVSARSEYQGVIPPHELDPNRRVHKHCVSNMARTKKSVNAMKEVKRKAAQKRRVYSDPPMGTLNPLAEAEKNVSKKDEESTTPEKKAKTDEVRPGTRRGGGTLFDPSCPTGRRSADDRRHTLV